MHPINEQVTPTEIVLHRQSRLLEIAFADGARFSLPCEYLRVYSPSSAVAGYHSKRPVLQVGKEQVNIVDLQQIGNYALKIIFDDHHTSGLYTWRYLYDLGANRDAHWADYLQRLTAAGRQRQEAAGQNSSPPPEGES